MNNVSGDMDVILDRFEKRMKEKQEKEDSQKEIDAERLRQAYLRRTGRDGLKP